MFDATDAQIILDEILSRGEPIRTVVDGRHVVNIEFPIHIIRNILAYRVVPAHRES